MDVSAELERSQRFCDVSQDLLCTANFDGYFTFLHPKWTETLGYEIDEIIHQPFMDFVHPDDRAATTRELEQLATGKLTFNFENRYRAKNGHYVWFLWNATAFPKENLIFASARIITERKEIESFK